MVAPSSNGFQKTGACSPTLLSQAEDRAPSSSRSGSPSGSYSQLPSHLNAKLEELSPRAAKLKSAALKSFSEESWLSSVMLFSEAIQLCPTSSLLYR